MDEWGKVVEVGLIVSQTCEKKIYVVKKFLGKIFLKFFSLNLILFEFRIIFIISSIFYIIKSVPTGGY